MKKKLKAAWVKALKSGEYAQDKGVLHALDRDAYCCLGVLCEVSEKIGVRKARRDSVSGRILGETLGPDSAQGYGYGLPKKAQEHLMEMNDVGEQDFTAIAEWIQKNVKVKPRETTRRRSARE